jgi:hypothetical protein
MLFLNMAGQALKTGLKNNIEACKTSDPAAHTQGTQPPDPFKQTLAWLALRVRPAQVHRGTSPPSQHNTRNLSGPQNKLPGVHIGVP